MGPYTGTFQVDLLNEGTLEGRLLSYLGPLDNDDPPSLLQFMLTLETETDAQIIGVINADVTDTGAVTQTTAGIELTGNFDFDNCEASGTWNSPAGGTQFYTNGTWRLSVDSTAY